MNITVRSGRVEGCVSDEMIAEQTCGHREAGVVRVVTSVGSVQLHIRIVGRGLCTKGHRTAERTVTVGGRTDTSLNLNTFQNGGVAVHIRPEDALVLRRVERNAIDRDIDSGIPRPSDTHISRTCTETVLAPGKHTRSRREQERKFLAGS